MKRVQAGSIGGSMGVCKSHAPATKNSGALHMLSVGRNTVLRRAFTSSERFPFGIKVLKEFTYHQIVNLKRVLSLGILGLLCLKSSKNTGLMSRVANTIAQIQSSLLVGLRGVSTQNGRQTKSDISVPTHGYKEITDEQTNARIAYNRFLDSLALTSRPVMNGLLKTK